MYNQCKNFSNRTKKMNFANAVNEVHNPTGTKSLSTSKQSFKQSDKDNECMSETYLRFRKLNHLQILNRTN